MTEDSRRLILRAKCAGAVHRAVALAVLVTAAPLLVIVALAILVTSGRPIIFKQTRVGQFGAPFTILKFRTMRPDAERELLHQATASTAELAPYRKPAADPRITRIGKLLRVTSLDELPQLLNVARGEMALVGPRPLVAYESALCPAWSNTRLLVKPGMTGLWQVSGRSDVSAEQALRLDVEYVQSRCWRVDLSILVRSVVVPLRRQGAR